MAAKRASACAPNGQVVYRLEALVRELQQQAGLAHARVACGKVAAVGAMGDMAQGLVAQTVHWLGERRSTAPPPRSPARPCCL